jgi:transposase
MLYTGIDLHRRSIVVCTLDENGSIVERRTMKTEPELVTTYFRQWPAQEHRAVVECTSNWYWLCDLLRTQGIGVVLAHAKYLKAIAYAKVKTDAVDAYTLAQLITYYVLSRQEPCKTFKGIEIKKLRVWPRTCKPVRLTGEPKASPLA